MRLVLAFFLLFCSATAFAKTCCICQTDSAISSEVPFYKAGCALWLAGKLTCSSRKIVSIDDDLDAKIPKKCDGGLVKLGYVGHWGSASESVDMISRTLVPINQKRKISFDVHNTACYSTDDTVELQNYLMEEKLAENTHITWKGNQVISVGMWNKLLPWKENFYSQASSKKTVSEYPRCKEFENKMCWGFFQHGQQGICYDGKKKDKDEDKKLRTLTCCKAEMKVKRRDPVSPYIFVEKIIKMHAWVNEDRCLEQNWY